MLLNMVESVTTALNPCALSKSCSSAHCVGGLPNDTGWNAEVSTIGSVLSSSVHDRAERPETEMVSISAGAARARD